MEVATGVAMGLDSRRNPFRRFRLRRHLRAFQTNELRLHQREQPQLRPLKPCRRSCDRSDHARAIAVFISPTAVRRPTNTARDTIACPMWSSCSPAMRAIGPTFA